MKIVLVDSTMDGSVIGGAQTFLPPLMKRLKKNGHEIHLVTTGVPDKKINKPVEECGAIIHTALWNKKKLPQDAAVIFAEWINDLNPDIYLISVSADVAWLTLPFLNSGIATFTIGHTDDETFYLPARHYHSFITKAIGVSDEVCSHYIKECHFIPADVQWIPYGVKTKTEPPERHSNHPIQLVYVGRVVEEQKRISDLIKIVQQLSAVNASFHLKIIGDGTEMPLIKEALKKEIDENKVETLGWLKNEDILQHLYQSDLFLLTSSYEGFCIALVEAMANGCCPLVTDIKSGNSQLISNGVNGFVFPIGDTNAFAKKITELFQNQEALYSMRLKAWEAGKKYGVDRMVTAYLNCFKEGIESVKNYPRQTDSNFPVMETCRSAWPLWLRRIKTVLQ